MTDPREMEKMKGSTEEEQNRSRSGNPGHSLWTGISEIKTRFRCIAKYVNVSCKEPKDAFGFGLFLQSTARLIMQTMWL